MVLNVLYILTDRLIDHKILPTFGHMIGLVRVAVGQNSTQLLDSD
jgi:hypothetical protein